MEQQPAQQQDKQPQHQRPLTASQRLKRTLQEYEQSILQQQAASEQELQQAQEEAAQTEPPNTKQVRVVR